VFDLHHRSCSAPLVIGLVETVITSTREPLRRSTPVMPGIRTSTTKRPMLSRSAQVRS